MTPVLSTDVCFPRFVLQRTGTPVCLGSLRAVFPPAREPSVSRRGARFGEPAAVPKLVGLRSACAGVPLTLRRRAPHRAEASTEVKPPPWRGLAGFDRTNVHRVGPLVTEVTTRSKDPSA